MRVNSLVKAAYYTGCGRHMSSTQSPAATAVLGVGFGPANLALAVALREIAGGALAERSVFLEKQPRFGWHRGMLIDGATMQVSFLKDLVTLRNPRSPYTFVAYLDAQGRLVFQARDRAIAALEDKSGARLDRKSVV